MILHNHITRFHSVSQRNSVLFDDRCNHQLKFRVRFLPGKLVFRSKKALRDHSSLESSLRAEFPAIDRDQIFQVWGRPLDPDD